MAKASVLVNTDLSTYMVVMPPVDKMQGADDAPKVRAFDRETAEVLSVITLAETFKDRAQVIKVTVPESQIPEAITPGMQVRPVEMIASVWANKGFGDQVNSGLSYRAKALELAQ
ncbi:hypothetical protein [Streptomyces sp. NPDC051776]|uniref:hypothetical protein n=1 Tax=Streptomyces sp. NPDC051776 TaxID=3155414 RepID=UPI00342B26CD